MRKKKPKHNNQVDSILTLKNEYQDIYLCVLQSSSTSNVVQRLIFYRDDSCCMGDLTLLLKNSLSDDRINYVKTLSDYHLMQ